MNFSFLGSNIISLNRNPIYRARVRSFIFLVFSFGTQGRPALYLYL